MVRTFEDKVNSAPLDEEWLDRLNEANERVQGELCCTRLSFRMIGLNSVSKHDYKSFFSHYFLLVYGLSYPGHRVFSYLLNFRF